MVLTEMGQILEKGITLNNGGEGVYEVDVGYRAGVMWVPLKCDFFFQAEDGIRDADVTGVQTCALPIFDTEDNNLLIEFSSVNTKSNFVSYSYMLEGYDKEWSEWGRSQEAYYNNLRSGNYVFKVRASVDGENISEASELTFRVSVPFYRNKWFIISVITLLIVINILILDRTRSFNRSNIILSRDVGADRKIASSIIAFGAFANTSAHIFAPR